MDAFESLHTMVRTDPDAAWPQVLAFIGATGETAEAQDLIQDFVYEHDDRFIDRIEAAAAADSHFAQLCCRHMWADSSPTERSRSIACKTGLGSSTGRMSPADLGARLT